DNAVLADKVSALRTDLTQGGPNIFGEELKVHRARGHAPYWVRLLDAEGRTLTETPGMDRILPVEVFPLVQNTKSSPRSPNDYRTAGRLFSLVTTIETFGGRTYAIQVAQDRS